MNDRLYISADAATVIEPIEELSRVFLLRELSSDEGDVLPAGATGTVVSVYGAGEAYCVEFTSPIQAEIVVENSDLEAIVGETRERITKASKKHSY